MKKSIKIIGIGILGGLAASAVACVAYRIYRDVSIEGEIVLTLDDEDKE